MSTFSEQLQEAIRRSGTSRYVIARESGLSQALLCRFLQGTRGLSLASIDKLTDVLGLDVLVKPRERGRK